ncbi:GSCOCG00011088001-RA-CDS, partial [Cotesia congregata]
VSVCQGCAVLYSNRIEKRHTKVRLSSWTVVIDRNSFALRTLDEKFVDYGTLIHPQAVLTLNSTVLYKPFRNYKCLGGCGDFQPSALSIKNCQIRDFGRIFSGHLDANKHANPSNTFAIIILKTPFDLGNKISVINVSSKPINSNRCYFYGVTALSIINKNNLRERNVSPVSPYRAITVNGSAHSYKCGGVNYTQVVEDTYLKVEKSEIVFKYNYRATPVVCQNNKTNKYEQVGFLSLYADTRKPYAQQRREVFIGTTFGHKRIYQILNKY